MQNKIQVHLSPEERAQKVAELVEHIINGGSLHGWCEENVPWATVWGWMSADPKVCEAVRNAQVGSSWRRVEEMMAIADDASEDYTWVTDEDGTKRLILVKENIARSRLRCDVRWKLVAALAPSIWGTKLAISGDPNSPITVVSMSDAEREHKIRKLLNKAVGRPAKNRLNGNGAESDDENGPVE